MDSPKKSTPSQVQRLVDVDIKGACCFQLQARDEPADQDVGTEEDVNVEFVDVVENQSVALEGDSTQLYKGIYSADYDLKTFLSRPTRIYTTTLAQGAAWSVTRIDPWSLFLGDTAIAKKLENYRYMRATMKINVLVNSTPFIYGLYGMSYCPLPTNSVYDIPTTDPRVTSESVTSYTQRPTIYIKPHTNEGGMLTLPFWFPENFITIQGNDRSSLGRLDLYPIVALQSASTSAAGCSVSVYAWLEDVTLAAPTLALQGKDEYATGPVSYPASVIAGMGKRLRDVPVLGKFARATEIAAGAVSQVAALFGFTKVPVIENSSANRIMYSRGMASGTVSDVHEKLSLDPKNELTVSTDAFGFPGGDELNVAQMCERQCVLTTVPWLQADLQDANLFTANVTPTWAKGAVVSGTVAGKPASILYDTPMGNVSRMFRCWRGDVVVTMRLIASQYHQGRLIVAFDPAGSFAGAGTENQVVTKVWDIQETDAFSFKIPFVSSTNWKNCSSAMSQDFSVRAATALTFNDLYHTGRLSVRVGNTLTGPISSANATLVVSVHMENGEFANPIDIPNRFTVLPLQGKEQVLEMAPPNPAADESYLINMGERVQTLRTLMQRENFYRRDTVSVPIGIANVTIQHPQYPGYFGYQVNGDGTFNDNARTVLTAGSGALKNFWWANEGPIQWMACCFAAIRGSCKWRMTVVPNSQTVQNFHLSIGRCPWDFSLSTNPRIRTSTVAGGTASNAVNAEAITNSDFSVSANAPRPTGSGITLASGKVNPSVVAEIPLYTQYNFLNPGLLNIGASGNANRDIYWYASYLDTSNTASTAVFESYVAAGTDFTLAGFVNVPPRYYITYPDAI